MAALVLLSTAVNVNGDTQATQAAPSVPKLPKLAVVQRSDWLNVKKG
jgi:hypothetical protein